MVRQDPGDYVYPVDSNVAPASKLNAITTRSLHLDVKIDAVGNALDTLDVTWDNPIETPVGKPYRELPTLEDLDILGMYFRLLAPERSRVEDVSGGSLVELTAPAVVDEEAGRAVIGAYTMVPPGKTTLRYVWTSPYAADVDEHGRGLPPHHPEAAGAPARAADRHDPRPGRLPDRLRERGPPGIGRRRDPDHDLQPGRGAGPPLRRDRHAGRRSGATRSSAGLYILATTARGSRPMELRHQLGVLRSWAWLIVVSVLLAGAAAFVVSNALPKVYEGKATLVVGQGTQASNPDYNQLLASQRLSQTYAKLATAGPLLQKVIDKNGLGITPDEFEKRIVAQAPTDLNLLYLTVQDGDPTRAATLANSLANEMVADSPALAGAALPDVRRACHHRSAAPEGH